MKKFFITIGILVLGLSIFGIYDNSQKKKEEEAIAAKTSRFTAVIESIEGADGEKKITVAVDDQQTEDEKFKGKKYSFTEGKVEKLEVLNEKQEKIEIKDLEVGRTINLENIGEVKDGDINELLGEIKIILMPEMPAVTPENKEAEAPTEVAPTEAETTPATEATEAPAAE